MMEEWFGQQRRMYRLQSSFRAVNSPIPSAERHGSQNVQAELAHTPILEAP